MTDFDTPLTPKEIQLVEKLAQLPMANPSEGMADRIVLNLGLADTSASVVEMKRPRKWALPLAASVLALAVGAVLWMNTLSPFSPTDSEFTSPQVAVESGLYDTDPETRDAVDSLLVATGMGDLLETPYMDDEMNDLVFNESDPIVEWVGF